MRQLNERRDGEGEGNCNMQKQIDSGREGERGDIVRDNEGERDNLSIKLCLRVLYSVLRQCKRRTCAYENLRGCILQDSDLTR